MHQLTGTRQQPKGNPPGRKLTFPPMQGITPEQQQRSRKALIARKHAAQQKMRPTAFGARLAWFFFGFALVLAMVLVIIGVG